MGTGFRRPGARSGPRRPRRRLSAFLERHQEVVLDVVPGALRGGRRLLLGDPRSGRLGHAVAVADSALSPAALDAEQRVLELLPDRLDGPMLATVPAAVERVQVDTAMDGLVVSAVPGLRRPAERDGRPETRLLLPAADAWLAALWRDTAGSSAIPVDLGREAAEELATRYDGAPRLALTVMVARRARDRLSRFEVPRTVVHGCLCPRHVCTDGATVVGVDDWTAASVAGDPLRDLGGLAAVVAGDRLPEVVAGRTAYAAVVRRFVTAGLERTSLPRQLWREVLLLTQLERAVTALDHGDAAEVSLLMTTVRALPGRTTPREMRRT